MRKLIFLLIPMLLFTSLSYAQEPETTAEPDLIPLSFTFDDLERSYWLHVPEQLEEPAPMVLLLHGRFGTGETIAELTNLNAIANQGGFIAVYPDAIEGEWNFMQDVPGTANAQDDMGFLIALVDEIAATYPVDLSRVYLAGFSNGGFMAQRVACQNPTRFAAFATVSATAFGGMEAICLEPGTAQAPILLMHGTEDTNVPWDGIEVSDGNREMYMLYPVADTLAFWAAFNDCNPDADMDELPQIGLSPGTAVQKVTFDCAPEASVILYMIVGAGHNWPGQELTEPRELFGLVNYDIDAGRELWRFFEKHQRPQGE